MVEPLQQRIAIGKAVDQNGNSYIIERVKDINKVIGFGGAVEYQTVREFVEADGRPLEPLGGGRAGIVGTNVILAQTDPPLDT